VVRIVYGYFLPAANAEKYNIQHLPLAKNLFYDLGGIASRSPTMINSNNYIHIFLAIHRIDQKFGH
jgi:hypothetical protein